MRRESEISNYDDCEIRDLRKQYGKIRPEETTFEKNPCEIEIKTKRRSAVSFTEHKIEPVGFACQVCYILDGLYTCTICNRFICIRDTYKVNELYFCRFCNSNNECIPYINALHTNENKMTCKKKIKESIKYAFSFEWLYKNTD